MIVLYAVQLRLRNFSTDQPIILYGGSAQNDPAIPHLLVLVSRHKDTRRERLAVLSLAGQVG